MSDFCKECGGFKVYEWADLCYNCWFFKKYGIRINSMSFTDDFYKELMEKILGRKRKEGEVVHHLDGNHKNNHPRNLYLCKDRKEHGMFHSKMFRGYITVDEDDFDKRFLIFFEYNTHPKFGTQVVCHIAPKHDNELKISFNLDSKVYSIEEVIELYKRERDVKVVKEYIEKMHVEYYKTHCIRCRCSREKGYILCPKCHLFFENI